MREGEGGGRKEEQRGGTKGKGRKRREIQNYNKSY